jgi:hypothetical protein
MSSNKMNSLCSGRFGRVQGHRSSIAQNEMRNGSGSERETIKYTAAASDVIFNYKSKLQMIFDFYCEYL